MTNSILFLMASNEISGLVSEKRTIVPNFIKFKRPDDSTDEIQRLSALICHQIEAIQKIQTVYDESWMDYQAKKLNDERIEKQKIAASLAERESRRIDFENENQLIEKMMQSMTSTRELFIPSHTNPAQIDNANNVHQCVSVLNQISLFRDLIHDSQDIIAAMDEEGYPPVIRCLKEQDVDGCIAAIRLLIDTKRPDGSIQEKLFKEMPSFIANISNNPDECMSKEFVGASISLALKECLSTKIDKDDDFRPGVIVGSYSPLIPLISWSTYFGHSILSLKKTLSDYLTVEVTFGMKQAIQLMFIGSQSKRRNLTYSDIRKVLQNKLDFDFAIYDPTCSSVIERENQDLKNISQTVELGAILKSRLGKDKSQASSEWSKYPQITCGFTTYIVDLDRDLRLPTTAVNGNADLILTTFTDISKYGSLTDIEASLIIISDDKDYTVASLLTEKWRPADKSMAYQIDAMHACHIVYERSTVNDD